MRRRARWDVGAANGILSKRNCFANERPAVKAPCVNKPRATNPGNEGGDIEMAAKKKAAKKVAKKAAKK